MKLRHYQEIRPLCGDLLPSQLDRNDRIPEEITVRPKSTHDFVERLYEFGNANARYGNVGAYVAFGDLSLLDSLVYSLRRLVCPLDEPIDDREPDITHRCWLTENPEALISKRGRIWERIRAAGCHEIGSAANCNLPFTPSDWAHDWSWEGSSGGENPLERDVFQALSSDDRNWAMQGAELSGWLLANTQVDRATEKAICQLVDEAKRKLRF